MIGASGRMSGKRRGRDGARIVQPKWLDRNLVRFLENNNRKRETGGTKAKNGFLVVAAEACTELE